MEKFIITGGKPLKGTVTVGGAKNVAMKVVIAGLLTDEPLIIHNIPHLSSVLGTTKIIEPLGIKTEFQHNTLKLTPTNLHSHQVPLELGGLYRSATMVIGPLLARFGKAVVPNPGGCRLGKRPINWHIEALKKMGARIKYRQGYFYAEADKLSGAHIHFPKNTHTGTETVLLAAVLADGETIIENAAEEPEVDDLINLLVQMGAHITRQGRIITIRGVKQLHGTTYTIMPDRNEVVTYAVAALVTKGEITIKGTQRARLAAFLQALDKAGAGWKAVDELTTTFFYKGPLLPTHITTNYHPGFMTDWQAPWAVLAMQANGESTIHETVFESRFQYVMELRKMGAKINFFDPKVVHPDEVYNFQLKDKLDNYHLAIRINGPTQLHEAVVEISDLRAGATLVLAALAAKGNTVLLGIDQIDRGYEKFDEQLVKLGARIKRIKENL